LNFIAIPAFYKCSRTMLCMLVVLLSAISAKAQQQIYSYSQYADNLTPINPAYSLLDKAGSLSAVGRKQFVGIEGAPSSLLFNANLPISSIGGAAGVYVLTDQIAVERQVEVNAFFAKAIQLEENQFLAVSLNAGIRNYLGNYSSLDPNDLSFKEDIRETRPNIGFGVMFFQPNLYYVGISVPELTVRSLGTASVQQANYLKNHYYFAAGALLGGDDDIKFKPATLISYVKGSPLLADVSGTFYLKDQLGLGANYRSNKKVAGIISITTDTFKVGYAYQFGVASNNLGAINTAIHEVSLMYRFGATSERKLL
jgi:type IX secretion system PorP/SprF family membrane protein